MMLVVFELILLSVIQILASLLAYDIFKTSQLLMSLMQSSIYNISKESKCMMQTINFIVDGVLF